MFLAPVVSQNPGLRLLLGSIVLLVAIVSNAQNSASQATQQASPQLALPKRHLAFGQHHFVVQMATQPDTRAIGLMHRTDMPKNEGMLFVFEKHALQCFWMKNTLIPLSAAFIADDGRIVNIARMQPLTTTAHCSKQPVRFVLEMHQGWFKQRGIGVGATLQEHRPAHQLDHE